jgi:cytochrome b561
MTADRYHPLQAALHWASAVAVVFVLAMGLLSLSKIPNSDAAHKIFALKGHMTLGALIGLLMLARLALRFALPQPARASTGSAWLDRVARVVHYGMYFAAFGMVASGIAMALQADLPAVVFGGAGQLPDTFAGMRPRQAHGAFASLLVALIAMHLAGSLYHLLVRRDALISRMRIRRQAR